MLDNILQQQFLGNRVLDYLIFLVVLLLGFLVITIVKRVILNRLKKWSERTTTELDDILVAIIEKSVVPLLYYGVFFLAVSRLVLHPTLQRLLDVVGVIILTAISVRVIIRILEHLLRDYMIRKKGILIKETNVNAIIVVSKVLVWGMGLVFLLDNLGFKISAVVTGLGIGGVAMALAAQAVLKDLFSFVAIMFDRPFEVGDFIIVGDFMGAVEHIGIKTTRIRSLSGEQLVFANSDLTDSRIRNYKRMQERRVLFKLGVTYDTGLDQVKEIPGLIRKIIEATDKTRFDRSHFASFGDFSLNFETVYYVLGSDYTLFMDIQQGINFALKEEFGQRGIEFAFPTQTLYLEGVESSPASPPEKPAAASGRGGRTSKAGKTKE